MIRLSKIFKRKPQADEFERASVRVRRTTKNTIPRGMQRTLETEEVELNEDPEQQRARHRLIGAAVLVLIAVIGLPRILDSQPKTVSNDIAVNIVTSLPAPNALAPTPDLKAPVTPSAEATSKEKEVATTAAVVKDEPPKEATVVTAPTETKVEDKPASATKSAALGLAAGEEVVASASQKPKPAAKVADTKTADSKTSANGSGKFVIQIGAFASEDRAKGWVTKLKDQKIPNYTLTKTGADGVKLYVLRAGPFTGKDSADSAEKKIKAMGLSPRVVELGGN